MYKIERFPFNDNEQELLTSFQYGENWPVVYLLEGSDELYVGETTTLRNRAKAHAKNPERNALTNMYVITDEEYNKSAALDIESRLIQYFSGDEKYILQNKNGGLQNHLYYDREKYKAKFELIREMLRKMKIATKSLDEITNSQVFKYSPYKSLSTDQLEIVEDIFDHISSGKFFSYLVHGKPGTGKTVLATYLVKYLKEQEETSHLKVGLVIPMTSLRDTIRKVFRHISGLTASMVLGPNDVIKDKYDILIVDEAHRLAQRKNQTNMKAFDNINKALGYSHGGNQLDWILASSKSHILFYDEGQTVRPGDVEAREFNKFNAIEYELKTQQRVKGGEEYIHYIKDIFSNKEPSIKITGIKEYEIILFDDISEFINLIYDRNEQYGLSRIVAGYAWQRKSRNDDKQHDIEIDGHKLRRNSVTKDRVNSENSINEVGCIHTIQGYDLNYVGVIIGPEISYDFVNKKFVVNIENYHDKNGKRGVSDIEEIERYILNIYTTLLTRGILGTYIYVVDDNLRKYLKTYIQ